MLFDPLIDEIAALPLEMLVQPLPTQNDSDRIACLCPLCKASDHPFIIFKREMGGLYGRPVRRWYCPKTNRGGYGAIELYAAMTGRGFWWRKNEYTNHTFICIGEDLRHVCIELCEMARNEDNLPTDELRAKLKSLYPEMYARDFRTNAPPQGETSFQIKADFSPQDLFALGCAVYMDLHGQIHYGFDCENTQSPWRFAPSQLQRDFNIFSIASATLPATQRNGELKSETIISTPWNPAFVCFAEAEPIDNEEYLKFKHSGSIFRPAMEEASMVFDNSAPAKKGKISRRLAGDAVFVKAMGNRNSETTGVASAVADIEPTEPIRRKEKIWQELEEKGKIKTVLVESPIATSLLKVNAVIMCSSAPDAVTTYYRLKSLRYTYPEQFGSRWYHVCWTYGKVPFSSVHYNKLSGFAHEIITLFPSNMEAARNARNVSRRYRDVKRASLPETISDKACLWSTRVFCKPVDSVRDFSLAYKMLPGESYQNDGDLNKLFSSSITSALSSMPFVRGVKRDKDGNIKEIFYTINPATLWEFMASAGFARDVRAGESDKIGRYVHIDGPFADELDPPSMVQATINQLIAYARQYNDSFASAPDEYEAMVQGVRRANKEINERTIASLPAVPLNYADGYGSKLEHFFYENGALRITPDAISLVPYEQLKFNVERGEVLPWKLTLPKNTPFSITENPEYLRRKERIEQKRAQKDDVGRPLYTISQLTTEENDLALWAQSHRWVVDWKGKRDVDMWPVLRVLRGFANEDWEKEQSLIHEGKAFSSEEQLELDNRFANLLFCLGRLLWRYRESKSNCVAYLMENEVSLENRAEGGSGKSTFVYIFAGCAAKILNVDCRDLAQNKELATNLADYKHRCHRIVHWEDTPGSFDLSRLYNYATGGFSVRAMYHDRISVPLSESPGHVVSSNYPISDLADSTMRRICIGGFSHRFAGQNVMKNKAARYISDIMPDFNATNPERLSVASRNQIAMICALAVQFVMKYDEKVDAQKKFMAQRALAQSLGESFLRFARVFFAQEHVFGTPQDLDSMLEEYKTTYAEASKNKTDSFSPKAFRRRILDYCETCNILVNPPQLFKRKDGTVLSALAEINYFRHMAWRTRRYFTGKEWEEDDSISPKQVRELGRTSHAMYFYRKGKDEVPADYDDLLVVYKRFASSPDPAPILDEQGEVVSLTEEEKLRWRAYLDSRQRKRLPLTATAATGTALSPAKEEDLPF